MINEWWSHLPDHAQSDLRSRLRNRRSDRDVNSALWELYLHEMLLRSGCAVTIHPRMGSRGYNPDFLVSREGEQFVVEAIWKAQSLGSTGSDAVPPVLVDAIDSVPSPNFFVSYTLHRAGRTTPSQKRLKADLTRWLADLDPDQVIAEYERKAPLPKRTWQEAGWRLSFAAIPRSPGKRGDPTSRSIGIHPAMAWFDTESDRVLSAVKEKGGKYGDLALPFIVAVGNAAVFPEDRNVENALYGTPAERVRRSAPALGRRPDGYWTATYDHTHSQVSGVLTVNNPAPQTWTTNTPVLWRSPDPGSLPAPALPTWATAQLVHGRVERQTPAAPVHTALGLPEHWPVGAPFPRRPWSNTA
ncbi:hypothetical protein FH965_11580 [Streptomyces spectabilis]|uniref:Uncharacterized protein n=1 Tax=Streptomyces spectabilis TaxID=68270 RepID=A0A516RKR1_STRST|nr:hypothetical protein FH965_11580 [Streptomyces spectabilis]